MPLLFLVATAGCEAAEPSTSTGPSAVPLDRLGPQERGSVERRYMGFKPPEGMRLDARFPLEVHLIGPTPHAEAAAQIREQVHASHVQLEGSNLIFPRAVLRGGDPNRPFRITVSRAAGLTRIRIQDETSLPAPKGLSEADRYRNAGITPDGKQLDTRAGGLE